MNNFNTRVYIASTDGLNDDALFGRLYHTVSRDRRDKIDRLIFQKDKCLSLAAELLLRKGLSDMGIESFEVETETGGKPYIKNSSIPVSYNLSHSENVSMCVISPSEVGCDVERITDIDMEIPRRFFCPSEYEMLMKLTDIREQREMFFRLWTLKESFVKLLGTGMATPPDSYEIQITGGNSSVLQNITCERYYFKEYDFHDGYKYAVCGLSPDFGEAEIITLK